MNVPDVTLAPSALEQKTVRLSFQNERLVCKFGIDLERHHSMDGFIEPDML